MRLEAEGFVALEQNKGFRVAEVSAEHLHDLQRTRIEIESVALRWAIAEVASNGKPACWPLSTGSPASTRRPMPATDATPPGYTITRNSISRW